MHGSAGVHEGHIRCRRCPDGRRLDDGELGMTKAAPATPGPANVPEVSQLALTVATDNYYDCLRPNDKNGKRQFIGP
ncbi:MAG: hypothetical protein MZU84_06050 [Sphingobacterium sp.]|nr:hypothetical protein [Sphingobacterium sp.]